jgi:hypothetical protein
VGGSFRERAAPRSVPDRRQRSRCVDHEKGQVGLDAAQLGAADPNGRDDLVFSCVDQLNGLGSELVERVEPVLYVSADVVLAMHRPTVVGRPLDGAVVDVLSEVLKEAINPTPGKRLVGGSGGFHVLLRHRPRSISRRGRRSPNEKTPRRGAEEFLRGN